MGQLLACQGVVVGVGWQAVARVKRTGQAVHKHAVGRHAVAGCAVSTSGGVRLVGWSCAVDRD